MSKLATMGNVEAIMQPSRDPHAPPASRRRGSIWAGAAPPLPRGVRRFRIEPAAVRPFVARAWLRRAGVVAATALATFAVLRAVIPGASIGMPTAAIVALTIASTALRARALHRAERALADYELLLAPRVLRRVAAKLPAAEILRPEVSAIVETHDGLWVTSDAPARALFVARAIDGYDEVRRELATWRAIERRRGWRAYRFTRAAVAREGARDAVFGTALAADPSLLDELETVRAASIMPGGTDGAPPRRHWARVAAGLFAAALVVAASAAPNARACTASGRSARANAAPAVDATPHPRLAAR